MLRPRGAHPGVGAIELFFDLVYVFAIIQLSHFLLEELTWEQALRTGVLFAAVWWGWNYTAWAMNWLDPEHVVVRCLLAVLMLAALVMAVAIPEAFTEHAGLFVGAYLFLQLVRSLFMVYAFRRDPVMRRNYTQLLAWSVIAGAVWVLGAVLPDDVRLIVWLVAVLIDYAAPRLGFWLPGVGASDMSTWPLAEGHLAERNRLVFIIALGESILILGTTLGGLDWTPAVTAATVVGFSTILLLWWLYFSYRLGNAEHEEAPTVEATRQARGAYAYAHALMVGGAIVVAVGIELVLAHPGDRAGWATAAVILGGPAIYLIGNIIFNMSRYGRTARSRMVALAALAVLLPIAPRLPALVVGILVLAVLAVLGAATGELRSHDDEVGIGDTAR